jgi:hypothetical protein
VTDRITPIDSAAPSPIAAAPPAKRQDPKYKAAYETVANFGEVIMRRSAYYHQKNKKKKEMEKRASDANQYAGRLDDFPSMMEAHNMMKERDLKEYANIKEEMKKYDTAFFQQVDNLATALSTTSECQTSATPATAAPDLSAFEATFALFQKEFDGAKGQIRQLEIGRQEADDKIKKLEQEQQDSDSKIKKLETANIDANKDILALRTNCEALEQKQIQLESEITQLRTQTEARNKTLVEKFNSTESKVDLLEQSKVSSKALLSATRELRDSQNQAVADLKRQLDQISNGNQEYRQASLATFKAQEAKVSTLTAGLLTAQGLLDRVEQDKLDDLYDIWDTQQIPEKVERHEEVIDSLLKGMQLLQESNSGGGQPSTTSSDNEMTTLKATVQQHTANIAALLQRFNIISANVQKTTSDWGENIGQMIDEMDKRVHKLEQLPATHGASRTPAATPQLDARGSPAIGDARLEARVKAIEDQNLLERAERIQLGLNTAELSLKDSVERMNANTHVYDAGLQGIKRSLQEMALTNEENKRQLEAQQLALNALDTQINNIFTKQLAEAIVKQMDSFSVRLNPRMDVLEANVKTLDENITTVMKKVFAINPYSQQKRSASPTNRHASEDGSKKRKLVNGRASPHPAQPLRNGSSAHS